MTAASGVEGNRRLTASLGAVLLVLLAIEGGTIPFLSQLEVVHVIVGLILIPVVLLKLGTTFYRFVRYYTGDLEYRSAGPPHPGAADRRAAGGRDVDPALRFGRHSRDRRP